MTNLIRAFICTIVFVVTSGSLIRLLDIDPNPLVGVILITIVSFLISIGAGKVFDKWWDK